MIRVPLLIAAVVIASATATAAAATTTTNTFTNNSSTDTNSSNSHDKILHFPIIPHHHVIARRQRERQLRTLNQKSNNNDNIEYTDTLEVGGLYQGYGTHYVDLWVGSPPQRQTVIVDTGSGITAFPCSNCKDCGNGYHVDTYFQEHESTSFMKFQCGQCQDARCVGGSGNNNNNKDNEYCHLSVSYAEGSMWNAYQGQDITYLGGIHDHAIINNNNQEGNKLHSGIHGENPLNAIDYKFNMVFGCQTHITGLFKTQLADGIMGMCLKPSSIFNQMFNQKIIASPSFSLCFMRGEAAEKTGTIAGALTMGGSDSRLHSKPMVYAKGFSTKGIMHGVSLRKVYILKSGFYDPDEATVKNTIQVDIDSSILNSGSVIVDSGTTDTYMTRNLRIPFQKAFKAASGYEYIENGMTLTDDQVENLPTILLQLQGREESNQKLVNSMSSGNSVVGDVVVPGLAGSLDPDHPLDILIAITPSHYVQYDAERKKYVGRFSLTEGSGSVLGANTIRGHDVYFDIPERSRIGFAPSDCDYETLVTSSDGDNDDDEENEEVERKKEMEIDGGEGGGNNKNDDDYYEDNSSSSSSEEDMDNNDTKDFTFPYGLDYLNNNRTSVIFIAAASIIATAVAIVTYRRLQGRRTRYSRTELSDDHLNDLHLDTEIESLPALA